MKWKLLYLGIFFVFTTLTIVYSNKPLVFYQKAEVGKIMDTETVYHEGIINSAGYKNFTAMGGVIAFGIISAAALIAFSNSVKYEKKTGI